MQKLFVLSFGVLSLNTFSQNDIQVFNLNNLSNNNINIQKQSVQSVQTFASNVQLKRTPVRAVNKINVVNAVKANPISTNKSLVRRRRTVPQRNRSVPVQIQQPLPQINFINVPPQMNPLAQISNDEQIFQINVLENNLGNSFGNEQIQVQRAIQNEDSQVGHAGDFLEGISLDLNVPKMNIKPISFTRKSSSSNPSHKSFHIKNKLSKFNWKMKGKLSFKKKLRLKVDNCFKW